jgi:hypothetical protein
VGQKSATDAGKIHNTSSVNTVELPFVDSGEESSERAHQDKLYDSESDTSCSDASDNPSNNNYLASKKRRARLHARQLRTASSVVLNPNAIRVLMLKKVSVIFI